MINVTCNKCGWVHFAVTEQDAKEQTASFMTAYAEMPQEYKDCYGDEPKTYSKVYAQYTRCFFCGQTERDFRLAKDDDCPVGCTIQPTIWEGENEG